MVVLGILGHTVAHYRGPCSKAALKMFGRGEGQQGPRVVNFQKPMPVA